MSVAVVLVVDYLLYIALTAWERRLNLKAANAAGRRR